MVCCWLIQAVAPRGLPNPDAISYLDISYSCLAGNWHALLNGYWSPGLPFMLTIWLKIFNPAPFHEGTVMHLFSFLSLIGALASFEYFISVFLIFRKKVVEDGGQDTGYGVPDSAIWLLGYSLFFWITTFLTPPSLEQPDILVFLLYLLASALSMQLVSYDKGWSRYFLLGMALGLGYLVKAVMFPVALTFYVALFFQSARFRWLPRLLFSVAVLLAVSLPFAMALSKTKGRFTFGDAGVIAYRHIMDMDEQPLTSTSIPQPEAAPHASEFTQIIHLGTYPPWSDPSHGYRATPFQFKWRSQLNRMHVVLHYYFDLFVVQLGGLLAGLLVLIFSGSVSEFAKRFVRQSVLWLPAAAGLAAYATMRVEGRFLAGFTIALFAASMASIHLPDSSDLQKVVKPTVFAVSLLLLSQSAVQVGHEAMKLLGRQKYPAWQVATTLHQMGLRDGDRVSYMGYALIDHEWAHLARLKVVAEIPEADVSNFWASAQTERVKAIQWLASSGARVLVTRNVPESAMSMGWTTVPDTDYCILKLPAANIHP
jgi:hypothetical protein